MQLSSKTEVRVVYDASEVLPWTVISTQATNILQIIPSGYIITADIEKAFFWWCQSPKMLWDSCGWKMYPILIRRSIHTTCLWCFLKPVSVKCLSFEATHIQWSVTGAKDVDAAQQFYDESRAFFQEGGFNLRTNVPELNVPELHQDQSPPTSAVIVLKRPMPGWKSRYESEGSKEYFYWLSHLQCSRNGCYHWEFLPIGFLSPSCCYQV